MIDINVTALEALGTLQRELAQKGIVLAIARANHLLQKMLKRSGLTERIGSEQLYPTVRTGVQALLERRARKPYTFGKRGKDSVYTHSSHV